jgi:dTDP-4-amino-4,6-dideoxyglucose formyltransferase
MKTLVLTDNAYALALAQELNARFLDVDVFQSPGGCLADVPILNVKLQFSQIIETFDLVVSIHCRQMFPSVLFNRVRCVNVHPGYNPYNRGWYPQVFSIINGLPCGVTIHEIDAELDHGPIIIQRECHIDPWDTSESVYKKLMKMEYELVMENFEAIRAGNYSAAPPGSSGNLNLRKDFESLRLLNLDEVGTLDSLLRRLKALSHGDFRNAYFLTESGDRVFVKLDLFRETRQVIPGASFSDTENPVSRLNDSAGMGQPQHDA